MIPPQAPHRAPHRDKVLVLTVALMAITFIVDLLMPLGVAMGIPYVLPVMLALTSPYRRHAEVTAGIGSALTLIGAFVPFSTLEPLWVAMTNRLLALAAIWATAVVIRHYIGVKTRLGAEEGERRRLLDVAESWFLVLDPDGRVASLNRKAREVLGVVEGEEVGLDWFDTFLPAETREEHRAGFRRAAAAGGTVPAHTETAVVTRKGDRRIVAWHHSVLRDSGGQFAGTLSSGTDVTEPRRTGAALQQSRKELEDMKYALDQASIVAITDSRGIIQYVNEKFCQVSGYRPDELFGQDHRVVNSGLHGKAFMADLWRTIGAGQVWRGEICNRTKGGTLYWVDTTIVPLLDDAGRPMRYLAIRTDITERKAAEALLREQESLARLGEMAAVVAHEVRNPLAGIGGALQIIQGRLAEGSAERRVIQEMRARLDALNESLTDLLEFARPRTPRLAPVPLKLVLEGTAALLGRDPRLSEVRVEMTGATPTLTADGDLLREVFLNLLLNAAQAMGGKGTIRVDTAVEGPDCQVAIRDQGPGIPKEIRERIFQPFFTTKSQGTGLGLAIVKRMVDMHGGDVTVQQQAPGAGTTFIVRLPLVAVPA
ncbi:PAS domain S-box protein [Myxococcota bacterium]|nr:PAS domain S-box protein [Myxococcota bacterium]